MHSLRSLVRNDVFLLDPISLSDEVKTDMAAFIDSFEVTEAELKSLRIKNVTSKQIKQVLIENYIG